MIISRKLYKPIQALTERSLGYLGTSKQTNRYKNEYNLINECFSTLDTRYSKAHDYIKENSHLIKCGVFFSFTNNTGKLTNITRVLSDLNVSFSTNIFTLMRINLKKHMEFIKMAEIEKIMSFHTPCLCITQQEDYLVFLLNLPLADDYVNRYISKLKEEIQYLTGYIVSCMVIYPYNNLDLTYTNLQLLNELAKYSYIFDKSTIITPTLVKNNLSTHRHMLDLYYMIDDFIKIMKSGNYENTSLKIDDLIDNIKLNVPEINITEMLTSYITILINRLSEQFDITLDHTLFEDYSKITSLDDYGTMLKLTCSKIISLIEAKKNEQRKNIIENVVQFMKENLDNVTLQLLSEQFSINKTYLNELFIKELGINYSDILKDLKIERAKELLKTGRASSRDVAEKVGYSNSKYFAQLFKLNLGYTPKEYVRAVTTEDSGLSLN